MANQVDTIITTQLENRDRVSALFRLVLVIPAAIYSSSFATEWSSSQELDHGAWAIGYSAGVLFLPVVLALVVRGVYPSYALSFNHALLELQTRVTAYMLLLTDRYPTIEANDGVAVIFPDVEGGRRLNRFLPLVKWLLAFPLYIVGFVYSVYALVMLVVAWLSIVTTGTMPASSADALLRVTQFWNRVFGYALALVTDEYPSFSL